MSVVLLPTVKFGTVKAPLTVTVLDPPAVSLIATAPPDTVRLPVTDRLHVLQILIPFGKVGFPVQFTVEVPPTVMLKVPTFQFPEKPYVVALLVSPTDSVVIVRPPKIVLWSKLRPVPLEETCGRPKFTPVSTPPTVTTKLL